MSVTITSSNSNQMCLLKDSNKELKLDGEKIKAKNGSDTILLYAGNMLQKSSIAKACTNDPYQVALLELLDNFSEEEFSSLIEISLLYDRIGQCDNICLKFSFTESLVQKLANILVEPKLSINGIFRTNIQSSGMLFGLASAYGLNPKPISRSFCSIGNISKEEQLITEFDGASDMVDYIKNCTLAAPSLTLYYSVKLQWKSFKPILTSKKVNVLKKMLQEKILTDCCIIAGNNAEICCHRSILSAHSDVFFTMFTIGLQESQTNRIEMNDISEEGVNALVNYFYQMKIDVEGISEEIAFELLQLAHRYNISNLESLMIDTLYYKPMNWFSLEAIISIYCFTSKIENYTMLYDKMLSWMKRNRDDVVDTDVFKNFMTSNPGEAANIAE
ncbi:unnamed protein product [Orchesella dallaii]|uniref:BTB domain-containing protein n=1 Tax=Orchesella dallaii TaxID=48710 RepID=A0ABP1PIT5_9HEXA